MNKEKSMSENILLRKEVITHERLEDGTTKITRVLDRRINEDSDRMVQKTEIDILI